MVESSMDYLRYLKISKLLQQGNITNKNIVHAFLNIQRHLFVSDEFSFYAYEDYPVPIGHKQYLNDPLTDAFLLETLDIKKTDSVLEIGSGSGYLLAILSSQCMQVYGVELLEPLYHKSSLLLKYLGFKNVSVVHGNGAHGYLELAPYDKIIISVSMKDLPLKIIDQLAPNGVLLVPFIDGFETNWTLFKKSTDSLKMRKLIPANVGSIIEVT